jgi:hypothetical protein
MKEYENSACIDSCNDAIDSDMNLKTCGDVVKYQVQKKWTQQTLAEKFRLSLRTVSNIHDRDPKTPLSALVLYKIEDYKRSLK